MDDARSRVSTFVALLLTLRTYRQLLVAFDLIRITSVSARWTRSPGGYPRFEEVISASAFCFHAGERRANEKISASET